MDLKMLLRRNARALMLQAKAGNIEERRAYRQFAGDYSAEAEVESVAPSSRRSEQGEPGLNKGEQNG